MANHSYPQYHKDLPLMNLLIKNKLIKGTSEHVKTYSKRAQTTNPLETLRA